MPLILLSLGAFLLGLLALYWMFIWERGGSSARAPLSFAYFAPQHLAFGLGGLFIAIFGQDWSYALFGHDIAYTALHGYFRYGDVLAQLELVNLVSLLAAAAGVRLMTALRRSLAGSPAIGGRASRHEDSGTVLGIRSSTLQRLCYLTLTIHATFVVLEVYWLLFGFSIALRYWVDIGVRDVAPAAFFLWGAWLAKARSGRLLFAAYFVLYGLVQLSTWGRGPFFYAVALFMLGYLVTPGRKRLPPLKVLTVSCLAVLLVWMFVVSSEIFRTTSYRGARDLTEMGNRMGLLIQGWTVIPEQADALQYTVMRFATRLVETSALTIVARTPESVPYAGWSAGDWETLQTAWLPSFLLPDVSDHSSPENDARAILTAYGFYFPPGDTPVGIPVSVLADVWRRWGWSGVVVGHFAWALVLSGLSALAARPRRRVRGVLFAAVALTIISSLYTSTLLGLMASLPRRLLVALVYSWAVSMALRLRIAPRSHVSPERSRFA